MTTDPQPVAWIDGDPLMEAIAAAVWERCEQHDSGLVVDDPRNIAAVAASVAASSAVAQSAPAETALRDRIRRAVCEANGFDFDSDMLEPDEYGDHADMILAALFGPIPAGTDVATWTAIRAIQLMNEAGQQRDDDRAALLRELIDEAVECDGHVTVQELRRMARKTAPTVSAEPPAASPAVSSVGQAAHTTRIAVLERAVQRIGQMADAWEQQLPDVIRTPAVVSAIRDALEPAAELPAPADMVACNCDAEVHVGAGFWHQPRCATRQAAASADRPAEEAYRLAVSAALRLGTGATWEAIRDRAEDLTAEVEELAEARRRGLDQQQPTADRAAGLNRAADFFRGLHATGTTITAAEAETELRRMAVEAQQQTEPELDADPQPVSEEFVQRLATVKVREDATVDPAMCPRCKGDNREAFALCPACAEADGRLLCPRCREDITDYDEDDHMWRIGDERPYCSGECVIAAHRKNLPTAPAVPVRHAPGIATLCADCRAKGHAVCMDGAEQQPGKEH